MLNNEAFSHSIPRNNYLKQFEFRLHKNNDKDIVLVYFDLILKLQLMRQVMYIQPPVEVFLTRQKFIIDIFFTVCTGKVKKPHQKGLCILQ